MQYHPKYPETLDQVLCKGCSAPIRGLIEDDRFKETRIIGGQREVTKKMIFASFPGYTEITINFNDGSKHVSNVCKTCAVNLTIADLEPLYMADLDAWEEIEKKGGGKVNWELYGARTPTGFTLGG